MEPHKVNAEGERDFAVSWTVGRAFIPCFPNYMRANKVPRDCFPGAVKSHVLLRRWFHHTSGPVWWRPTLDLREKIVFSHLALNNDSTAPN